MTALGLLLLGVGGILGWSGFTGRTPIEVLTGVERAETTSAGFTPEFQARLERGEIISGGAPALPVLPGVNAPQLPTPTGQPVPSAPNPFYGPR